MKIMRFILFLIIGSGLFPQTILSQRTGRRYQSTADERYAQPRRRTRRVYYEDNDHGRRGNRVSKGIIGGAIGGAALGGVTGGARGAGYGALGGAALGGLIGGLKGRKRRERRVYVEEVPYEDEYYEEHGDY